jgi:uncharacterized protein (DUF1684 family)
VFIAKDFRRRGVEQLDADPDRRLESLSVGKVSEEKRIQAGYSPPENSPTASSFGKSGRTRNMPWATPCGFRNTGRSAGHWPLAIRPA